MAHKSQIRVDQTSQITNELLHLQALSCTGLPVCPGSQLTVLTLPPAKWKNCSIGSSVNLPKPWAHGSKSWLLVKHMMAADNAHDCRFKHVCAAIEKLPFGSPRVLHKLSERRRKQSRATKPAMAFSQRCSKLIRPCNNGAALSATSAEWCRRKRCWLTKSLVLIDRFHYIRLLISLIFETLATGGPQDDLKWWFSCGFPMVFLWFSHDSDVSSAHGTPERAPRQMDHQAARRRQRSIPRPASALQTNWGFPWGYVIYSIGSMYGIYANIWGILMVNVTIYIYIACMDPMGIHIYINIHLFMRLCM